MKKPDLLSILLTFFVGVVAGTYIYLVGFAPTVASLEVASQEKVEALIIAGDVYGGCRAACPSFQVQGNGTYRYLHSITYDQPQIIADGTVPYALRRELRKNLTPQALEIQSQPVSTVTCNSYSDGVDVRYVVTRDGVEYLLDTCGTNVDTASPLWLSIKKIWDYLENDNLQ